MLKVRVVVILHERLTYDTRLHLGVACHHWCCTCRTLYKYPRRAHECPETPRSMLSTEKLGMRRNERQTLTDPAMKSIA